MSDLVEEGRAKVNLTLRVIGRRTDGYHDLESVVAFADCADKLTLTPGPDLALQTVGPLATACGDVSDNLVLKAARLLGEAVPGLKAGAFVLDKVLPAVSGLISRGVEQGYLRQVDPDLTLRSIIGPLMLHLLLAEVFRITPEGGLHFDRMVDNHLSILFDGLSAPPSAKAWSSS